MRIILGSDSIRSPLTGIGRYARSLGVNLLRSSEVERLVGFNGFSARPLLMQDLLSASLTEKTQQRWQTHLRKQLSQQQLMVKAFALAAPTISAVALRKYEGYVYHSPNFHLPQFNGPMITTIHDLSHLRYPHFHPAARVDWMNKTVPISIEKASHVIAISNATANDLNQLMGVPREKISVVYQGVDVGFHIGMSTHRLDRLHDLGLTAGRYLLCISTIEPRKNIDGLLDAYIQLPKNTRSRYPLVLIGAYGWRSEATRARISALATEGVVYLDYVNEETLLSVLGQALVAVYPSHNEGFGLPVLEAQALGTPIICSDNSSLPEVANADCLFFKSEDVAHLAEHLQRSIEDEIWREQCAVQGAKKVANFTWGTSVSQTLAIYQRAQSA